MIFGLQALRGVAVLLVVMAHVEPQLLHLGAPAPHWLNDGHCGVDIFFVISGFIIWVASQRPDMTILDFVKLRLIRIVPLYWAITALIVAVSILAPALLSSTTFNPAHVLSSFLFIPSMHPLLHDTFPVLVPGWTLNCEMYFYAIFALALTMPSRLVSAGVTATVIMAFVIFGVFVRPTLAPLMVYSSPIMLEFVLGLGLGVLHTHFQAPAARFAALSVLSGGLLLVASLALDASEAIGQVLAVGGPAALMVWGCSLAKRQGRDRKIPGLDAIGDASYSIYLTQVLALPVAAKLWTATHLGFDGWRLPAFALVAFAVAIVVGLLCHRLVEKPLLQSLRQRLEPKMIKPPRPQTARCQPR